MAQGNLVSSPLRGYTIATEHEGLRHRTKEMPTTPPRLSHSDDDSTSSGPMRPRVNSGDYRHSYEGAYGDVDDMTGFDIAVRNGGGWLEHQQWFMFVAYVIVLTIVWVFTTMTVPLSWTVTNVMHFLVTLIYLHWLKGGFNEDQGDLDHMTLWEQIDAIPHTGGLRLALRLVPTFVCYMACLEAGFTEGFYICVLNGAVWYLTLLGKMRWMNGVRIFGINSNITDKEHKDKET
jgi:ORMDL family